MSGFKRPNPVRRYFSEHARVCVAAFGKQWREPIGTLLSALVIGITLALPAGLELLVNNLRQAAGGLNETRNLTVFVKDALDEQAGRALSLRLAKLPAVARADYTSREQALEDFRERTELDGVLDALGRNPLPASITLVPDPAATPVDLRNLAASLRADDAVEQVQLDSGWSQRLAAALAVGSRLSLILAVGLSVAAVFAMGNTIRLDIEARREEIAVMQLIGAPAGFIRRPFLYAGFWYGLSGALIAVAALYVTRYALAAPVNDLVQLYEGAFTLRGPSMQTLATIFAAGVVLGLGGAWLAVTRHLGRV
ncbi:permease-like cell division protein FtsX [Panacagrimonas sp.]|uniref:permease-like cell division protein FtsX n=1 Tax=Panacagrimonas sp. TaxID=2480088 RepID=UPI003B52F3C0